MSTPEERLNAIVAETHHLMPDASLGEMIGVLVKRLISRQETDPQVLELAMVKGATALVEWELPIYVAEKQLREFIRLLFDADLPGDSDDAQRIVQEGGRAFLKENWETCLRLAYRRMEQIAEEEFEGLGIQPHPSLLPTTT